MDIWQEIAKNAEHGAERLVAEYGDRLYAAATLLCRNNADAEELVFRTLARAVDKIRQYSPSGDFFSWLYKILLNFHRMEGRKKRPEIMPVGSTQDLPQIPAEGRSDAAAGGGGRPVLTARTAGADKTTGVSCWMLLGYLRECFSRARSSRRKEEEQAEAQDNHKKGYNINDN